MASGTPSRAGGEQGGRMGPQQDPGRLLPEGSTRPLHSRLHSRSRVTSSIGSGTEATQRVVKPTPPQAHRLKPEFCSRGVSTASYERAVRGPAAPGRLFSSRPESSPKEEPRPAQVRVPPGRAPHGPQLSQAGRGHSHTERRRVRAPSEASHWKCARVCLCVMSSIKQRTHDSRKSVASTSPTCHLHCR